MVLSLLRGVKVYSTTTKDIFATTSSVSARELLLPPRIIAWIVHDGVSDHIAANPDITISLVNNAGPGMCGEEPRSALSGFGNGGVV